MTEEQKGHKYFINVITGIKQNYGLATEEFNDWQVGTHGRASSIKVSYSAENAMDCGRTRRASLPIKWESPAGNSEICAIS